MAWWAWLLLAWAIVATVVGLILGAAAAKARSRERAARRYLHTDGRHRS